MKPEPLHIPGWLMYVSAAALAAAGILAIALGDRTIAIILLAGASLCAAGVGASFTAMPVWKKAITSLMILGPLAGLLLVIVAGR